MGSDLLRQRRNLLIICGVLILFEYAGISIEQLTLLGTNINIGRPEVVEKVLWGLWAYFLLRYYQYLGQEDNLELKMWYLDYFDRLVKSYAEKDCVSRKFSKPNNALPIEFCRNSFMKFEYSPDLTIQYDGDKGPHENTYFPIPRYIIIIVTVRSLWCVSMYTPKVTDYIVPFFVALVAVVINYKFFLALVVRA